MKIYNCPNCKKIYSENLIIDNCYCPNINNCGTKQIVSLLDYAQYFFKIQYFNQNHIHINKPIPVVQTPIDKNTWLAVDGTNRIVAISSELKTVWKYKDQFGGEYRFVYKFPQITKSDLIEYLTSINFQLIEKATLEINNIQHLINDNKLNVDKLTKQVEQCSKIPGGLVL